MENLEALDDFFPLGSWKLHGGMCQQLWSPLKKLSDMFPGIEIAAGLAGIEALSMVNVHIVNSKGLLQHCTEYSKFYLAVIGNSLPVKFEKERSGLVENIKILEGLVVGLLHSKLVEVRHELEAAVFSLDESEKQVGEELLKLIQKDPSTTTDEAEFEAFHQVATKLGINTYKTALIEKRSLKRLLEQGSADKDELKEKVVAYVQKFIQKSSKLCRTDGDPDSSCSSPHLDDGSQMKSQSEIETVATFNSQASDNWEDQSGRIPAPPEVFKCPISLQLMYDPVVISTGHTFERVSIEKWLKAGHTTCPVTREHLSHVGLTPNFSVKKLISNWCEQNGVPVPANPPDSLDITPFQHALAEKGAFVSFTSFQRTEAEEVEDVDQKYSRWMQTLNSEEIERWEEKIRAVLEIRYHLKDDRQARVNMAEAGFVDPLVRFLRDAIVKKDDISQEVGAFALYNFAVNNDRRLILSTNIIPLMEKMIDSTSKPTIEATIALYVNLSCLNAAKPLLAKSSMTNFLIRSIDVNIPLSNDGRSDVMFALFNISTHPGNVPHLINSGIIHNLHRLVNDSGPWTDKAALILAYLAQETSGNDAIRKTPGLVNSLTALLESEIQSQREQAVSCLWSLCNVDENCVEMVLQIGVIPALVAISGRDRPRAKEKASRLLKLFRDARNKASPSDQPVIHLDQLRLNDSEIQEEGTSQQQDRIGRSASASATSSRSASRGASSSRGTDTESPRGLPRSRSRRIGRSIASLFRPTKHNSRKNKSE